MKLLPKILLAGAITAGCRAHAQLPVGELYATDASIRGSVSLSGGGTTVLSGSSISSGLRTALLRLSRGGELAICSGTHVSVSASSSGRDLMFSFGTGTIEARYTISNAADTIVTPDLRLLITGPGEFDLAVGIEPDGDTCVRSSSRSSGGVIVSETMGDGSYQVKPSELVVFKGARVSGAALNPAGAICGCPAPPASVLARAPEPALTGRAINLPSPVAQQAPTPQRVATGDHVQGDLQLAFRADAGDNDLQNRIVHLSVRRADLPPALRPAALPPVSASVKAQKRGFWRRLGSWFNGNGYR